MSLVDCEKWLLVEWGNTTRGIVHSRYLVNHENRELKPGCSVVIGKRGEQQIATLMARSDDRSLLDVILKESVKQDADCPAEEEPVDYSGSASDWAPCENDAPDSEDEDEVQEKKHKPQFEEPEEIERKPRKVLTPSNRANAIIPKSMQKSGAASGKKKPNSTRKRPRVVPKLEHELPIKHAKSYLGYKSKNAQHNQQNKSTENQPNNNQQDQQNINAHENSQVGKLQAGDEQNQPQLDFQDQPTNEAPIKRNMVNINVDMNDLIGIKNIFKELFKMFRKKRGVFNNVILKKEESDLEDTPLGINGCVEGEEGDHDMDKSRSDEFNRSDDNVLISNKYHNIENNVQIPAKDDVLDVYDIQNEVQADDEWIPIGSGKTFIHRNQFRKIKWTSYTMATRGLMLAVFPRRTLATHSLTGKRSPAFQNKPAKMCLNPKKVSDIIIEVMDRFRVKENLIRSIITTKCADECKMFRMRMEKKEGSKKKQAPGLLPAASLKKEEPSQIQN